MHTESSEEIYGFRLKLGILLEQSQQQQRKTEVSTCNGLVCVCGHHLCDHAFSQFLKIRWFFLSLSPKSNLEVMKLF